MGAKRRVFTPEFKIEAVRLVEESGRSKAQIARELGVHETLLKRWKAQLEGRPRAEAFPGNGNDSLRSPVRSSVTGAVRVPRGGVRSCPVWTCAGTTS